MKEKFEILSALAVDFSRIAVKINEASGRRKNHALETLRLIGLCKEVGGDIFREIEFISKENQTQRNRNNLINDTCMLLKENVDKQIQQIALLNNDDTIDKETLGNIAVIVNNFSSTLENTLKLMWQIIQLDNRIILMDKSLVIQKKMQMSSLSTMERITEINVDNTVKAITGSSANMKRGLDMTDRLMTIPELVRNNAHFDINNLMIDANSGWNTAMEVNKSSKAQLEFEQHVSAYMDEVHAESQEIITFVNEKHSVFESNLQNMTVLTVMLSLKFKEYLDAGKKILQLAASRNKCSVIKRLIILDEIAREGIMSLIALNYDMTDIIRINNESEQSSVDLTKKEIELYGFVKNEVDSMTEVTLYPIKGSNINITIGQVLERTIKEIIDEMAAPVTGGSF